MSRLRALVLIPALAACLLLVGSHTPPPACQTLERVTWHVTIAGISDAALHWPGGRPVRVWFDPLMAWETHAAYADAMAEIERAVGAAVFVEVPLHAGPQVGLWEAPGLATGNILGHTQLQVDPLTGAIGVANVAVDPTLPPHVLDGVALHEMIHALGLTHDPTTPGSVMYPYYGDVTRIGPPLAGALRIHLGLEAPCDR